MRPLAVYEVTGQLSFRGHKPGERFAAALAPTVERRRIEGGHLRLVDRIASALPARWSLPGGWT